VVAVPGFGFIAEVLVLQRRRSLASLPGVALLAMLAGRAHAQQFNSDNYLSKPAGVATIILTAGDRNSMIMTTFALLPKWEFTAAAYWYNSDENVHTDEGYSTSYYAKYMIFENRAKTGGLAVKAGTGLDPGYLLTVGLKDAFQTYWTNAPVTVPLFQNKVSVDLMPGMSVTRDYGVDQTTAWAFTYSARTAWYPRGPKWSVVGEVFGSEGQSRVIPEYKLGWRWEPNDNVVYALTYGQEFSGTLGAGVEAGVMFFTPPFACLTGCGK
jgi:hypothetical protein